MIPKKKAMATDKKMLRITVNALSELSRSPSDKAPVESPMILMMERTNAPPKSSNTIETVVEVGKPNELKMSSRIMSVIIMAVKMHMTS